MAQTAMPIYLRVAVLVTLVLASMAALAHQLVAKQLETAQRTLLLNLAA